MKNILFFLYMFLSLNAFSAEKVLLLTSFEEPQRSHLNLSVNRKNFHQGLERVFKKQFGDSPFEVDVHHDVEVFDLYQMVVTNQYKAVFWVSHANSGSILSDYLGSESILVNKSGINVKDIFYHLNPGTHFLGLVGCFSESIVKEFSDKKFFLKNPQTFISGSPVKVDALKGLRKSIRAFKERERLPRLNAVNQAMPQKKLKVVFKREANDENLPSLFIYNRDELLIVLPGLQKGESGVYETTIDKPNRVQDLKIVVSTNKITSDQLSFNEFGEMSIELAQTQSGHFDMLMINKKPVGTRTRIFKYVGFRAEEF